MSRPHRRRSCASMPPTVPSNSPPPHRNRRSRVYRRRHGRARWLIHRGFRQGETPPRWVTDSAAVPYDVERRRAVPQVPPAGSSDPCQSRRGVGRRAERSVSPGDLGASCGRRRLPDRPSLAFPDRTVSPDPEKTAAINVLREFLAQGPDAAKELHTQLERENSAQTFPRASRSS